MKVLEIAVGAAVGAAFALTRFSLVRISSRDLVADGNPKDLRKEFMGWGWGPGFGPRACLSAYGAGV